MAGENRSEKAGNISRLSERERQIAQLVSNGMRNRDIASELHISENTVKRHLQSIFDKTGARDRLELAVMAIGEDFEGGVNGIAPRVRGAPPQLLTSYFPVLADIFFTICNTSLRSLSLSQTK